MKRISMAFCSALLLVALPAMAGEWHSGQNNLCTDCHTMHFSQTHNWDGSTPVPTDPAADGNWLGASGPNHYLLKLPVNQLCLTCHDGQTFAPDVFGTNFNASPSEGRMAGALNDASLGAPYEDWRGHTLDSTDPPPGYNPAVIGAPAGFYDPTGGLHCVSCHAQHGPTTAYRNLGPFSLGGAAGNARPTYVIGTTNVDTQDVWIDIPSPYTPNSGNPAVFNEYYDYANVNYNRNDGTSGTVQRANRMDTFCGACHGDFHGGPTDTTVGGLVSGAGWDEFIRHPSAVTIGLLTGGHSNLSRFQNASTKVKVYSDQANWVDASPGCVSCHKAHGNQNPFGLFFLSRDATGIDEQGGYGASDPPEPPNGYQVGYRNLCGQCHVQGN